MLALLSAVLLVLIDNRAAEPDAGCFRRASRAGELGLRNFHRVCPELYRGGRLTAEGVPELQRLGIKTVISLRVRRGDQKLVRCTNIDFEQIPMKAWRPKEAEAVRFLQIATAKNRQPVFVYCNHGSDRAGMMCAIYRVVVCGWSKEEAIREMTQGGFGYHPIWKKVVTFVETLDVETIKRKAGLKDSGDLRDPGSAAVSAARMPASCPRSGI